MDAEHETVKYVLGLIGISSLAAASRTVLSADRRTIGGFLRGLVLAAFVGSITGFLIQDFGLSAATESGIVGVAAFVADDLLLALIATVTTIRENPTLLIDYIFRRRP